MSIRDDLEKMVREDLAKTEVPIQCYECKSNFTQPLRNLSRGNNTVTCPRCRKRITVKID